MKILNTKELNEKLNIQPVTKQQLSNHGREMWVNTKNWKDRLKTGDILFIRMVRRDDDGIVQHESLMCFRYVTFEDYFRYGYSFGSNFEKHIRSKKESKYGMLITYDHNKKTFRCIFLSTFYRDSNMTTNLVGNETTVTEIKRPVGTIEQPIKSEFFIRDNIKNTDTVCIYKDKSLNEKLDIKPITKGRLANMNLIENAPNWKSKLKTGDEAIITFNETRTLLCHFIRMTDFMIYYDNIILKDLTDSFYSIYKSKQCKDGFFVIPPEEVNKCTFIGLGYFKDDCMEGNANPNLKINELYRNKFKSVTLSESYFKNKKLDRLNAICLYADNGVNEKLAIQPISKDRLKRKWDILIKNERVWKQRLKTGDVVVFDIENKDTYTIATFISHSDFVKYHYDAMLKLEEAVEKCKTDQGFFVYSPNQGGHFYFTYNNVEDFFDDRMENTEELNHCWRVKAIYRYDNPQPQPFDKGYFENDTVCKELATLLYLDKSLPNKKMKV